MGKTFSGGLLCALCPHGIVYAIKFLLHGESQRDHVDIIKSLKYQPTLVICDIPSFVARHGNRRFPDMFGPFEGRFISNSTVTQSKLAEGKVRIDLPELDNINVLSTKIEDHSYASPLHPLIHSSHHFCAYDRFHQDNTTSRSEHLCRLDLVPQCSHINSEVVEEFFSVINKSNHFLTQMLPVHHIFVVRLLCHLKNVKRNEQKVSVIDRKLKNTSLSYELRKTKDERLFIGETRLVDSDVEECSSRSVPENQPEREGDHVEPISIVKKDKTDISFRPFLKKEAPKRGFEDRGQKSKKPRTVQFIDSDAKECPSRESAATVSDISFRPFLKKEAPKRGFEDRGQKSKKPRLFSLVGVTSKVQEPLVFDIARAAAPEVVLAKHGPFTLTATDFLSFSGSRWLTDQAIDAYLNMLAKRERSVFHITTQILTRILNGEDSGQVRVFKNEKLLQYEKVIGVYLQGGAHWTGVVIHNQSGIVSYYDPCVEKGIIMKQIIDSWRRFLEVRIQAGLEDKPKDFKICRTLTNYRQSDGYNCGVYTLKFIQAQVRKERFEINSPQDARKGFAEELHRCSELTEKYCVRCGQCSPDLVYCKKCHCLFHLKCTRPDKRKMKVCFTCQ